MNKVRNEVAATVEEMPPYRDMTVLRSLGVPEWRGTAEVAEELGISPQTLCTSLARLQRQGLMKRKHVGRLAFIALTECGWEVLQRAAGWQARAIARAQRSLSAQDRAALRGLVSELQKVL